MANTANMNIVNLFEELSDLLNKLGEPLEQKLIKAHQMLFLHIKRKSLKIQI